MIERIQKNVGVPWRSPTVDTFKAGSPDTPVQGIATTFMATLNVLQRAAGAGRNLVITHEPTFYNHEDATRDFTGDAVYLAKQSFIEKNRMVVWRFHDHWHARRPDGILTGMLEILGWDKYRNADNPRLVSLPATRPAIRLDGLAGEMQKRLKVRTMRVIGDPAMTVSKVALNPGYANLQGAMRSLARPEVDVGPNVLRRAVARRRRHDRHLPRTAPHTGRDAAHHRRRVDRPVRKARRPVVHRRRPAP